MLLTVAVLRVRVRDLREECGLPSGIRQLLVRSTVDRFDEHFGFRHRRWVERRPPPGHLQRQSREVHDATVPTVTTQVVIGPMKMQSTGHGSTHKAQNMHLE